MVIAYALGLALLQEPRLEVSLEENPKLQAALSFRERLIPVGELCAAVSQRTGVVLRPSARFADLKLAMRIKDRSAAWTLKQMAEVLDLEWKPVSDGYNLVQTPEAAAAEAKAQEPAKGGVGRVLADRNRAGQPYLNRSYAWIRTTLKQYGETEQAIQDEGRPGWIDRIFKLKREKEALTPLGTPEGYLLAQLAARGGLELPAEDEARVWANRPGLGFPIFDDSVLEEEGRGEGETYFIVTRSDLGLRAQFVGARAQRRYPMRLDGPTFGVPPDRYLKWYQGAAIVEEKLGGRAPQASGGLAAPDDRMTTDAWMESSELTGIDFIAEAFRFFDANVTPRQFDSVGGHWASYCQGAGGPFLKVVDGAVLIRPAGFWFRRLAETPERLLRPMMAADFSNRAALYDTAAAFANSLNAFQISGLAGHRTYEIHPNVGWARLSLPAFRVWSLLSAAQKRLALEREPIPYRSLSAAAQAAYRRAIMVFVHHQEQFSEIALPLLLRAVSGQLEDAAFLCEAAWTPIEEKIVVGRAYRVPADPQAELINAAGRRRDDHFYFGFDATTPVHYTSSLYVRNPKD